jgi:hypothetical protein
MTRRFWRGIRDSARALPADLQLWAPIGKMPASIHVHADARVDVGAGPAQKAGADVGVE